MELPVNFTLSVTLTQNKIIYQPVNPLKMWCKHRRVVTKENYMWGWEGGNEHTETEEYTQVPRRVRYKHRS
jgi:hypothetical protein